jgi:hypothetical protein
MGPVQRGMSEGRKPRRRSRRGWAALVALAGLASAGTVWGLAGDEPASAASCGHFVTTVRPSEPSYEPGRTVIITITQANDGPACTIPHQPCGPPQAVVSAYNSAGEDVWDYGASKTNSEGHPTCGLDGPSMTWAAGYSDTQELDWSQVECTRSEAAMLGQPNPDCPGTQLPAGTYRIAGEFWWVDGRAGGHGPSASATITISPARPHSTGRS